MFFILSVSYTALPQRDDAILSQSKNQIIIDASGSLGLRYYDRKCTQTYPNQTLVGDEEWDWCSNIMKTNNDYPWISYRIPNKAMKLRGFSVRNGCCHSLCCCDPETGHDIDFHCCCGLYSFSLQGSNDNHKWKIIHKVEKEIKFYECKLMTYEFEMTEAFHYIRLVMDEAWPRCEIKCIQINQIELYGETISSSFYSYEQDIDEKDEESVSIIGRIKKN